MKASEPGSELRAVLSKRGCALGADEARALAVFLIDLICDGLIVPDTSADCPALVTRGSHRTEMG